MILDFWPPEREENKFLSSEAILFMRIFYGSPIKLIKLLISILTNKIPYNDYLHLHLKIKASLLSHLHVWIFMYVEVRDQRSTLVSFLRGHPLWFVFKIKSLTGTKSLLSNIG